MNYSSIDLTIDEEEAKDLIAKRVSGVSRRDVDGSYEYKTNAGYRIATLTETTLPNGERGSRLEYRTTIVAPFASHARAKARRIREAVDRYRYR